MISCGSLQNRVDPWGNFIRTTARGTLMGNRGGVLHNSDREIIRPFKSRQWIACLLEFKGRRRKIMTPGLYTELFFLDEAVAFSAGHRPCAECRRDRFNAFRRAWTPGRILAPEMDAELHRSRRAPRPTVALASLPDGCFVEVGGDAYLIWEGSLLLWSPEGYTTRLSSPIDEAILLTPEPIVRCFREGYRPEVHPSALRHLRAG